MEENEAQLLTFIKTHAPESDRLEVELKQSQFFSKRKAKKVRKNHTNKKCKFLTRKEKKSMGLFHLPRKGMKYTEALPLYEMWKEYMKQQIELGEKIPDIQDKNWENTSQLVFKADYHGAYISIVSSKCPSLVGIKGICLMETKNTFKIISEDDCIRTVSKDQCEFSFDMGDVTFRIFGKHICRRPAERSVKQSKLFVLSEL